MGLLLHDVTRDARSVTHFVKALRGGTKLASRVRDKIDFDRGRFFVLLPEEADLSDLPPFEHAGYLPFRRRGIPTLAHIIKALLAEYRAAVLFQDTQVAVGDPWLLTYKFGRYAVSYSSEVYWCIFDPALSEEDIAGVIRSVSFYPFAAFVYDPRSFSNATELSNDHLDRVIKHLLSVIVGVFDEDSFLFWWSDEYALPNTMRSLLERRVASG